MPADLKEMGRSGNLRSGISANGSLDWEAGWDAWNGCSTPSPFWWDKRFILTLRIGWPRFIKRIFCRHEETKKFLRDRHVISPCPCTNCEKMVTGE